jgi:hypothetical protein
MKRIYTYLPVKCNIHVHVEINFKHLNTYVKGDICSHTNFCLSTLSLVAILVGSRDHRTQFWKGAIQESFQQSMVEIGSVVSEEKIFLKYHPPFFLICIIGQNWQKFKVHKKSCNTC